MGYSRSQGAKDLEIVLQQPNPAMQGEAEAKEMINLVGKGTT